MPSTRFLPACLRWLRTLLIPVCLIALSPASRADAETGEIDLVRQRLLADYLGGPTSQAPRWLAALDAEGRWADVNYADGSRATWSPMLHLQRITIMATAWRKGGGKDGNMLAGIQRALQYWYALDPQSANWWFNTIGAPHQFMRILILTEGSLPPALFKAGLARLKDPGQIRASESTGQNLVWHAAEQVVRGVLGASASDIAAASKAIQGEIRITVDEGIQPDYSFHQHGPQLYNGGYGIGFIEDGSYYAALLGGTRWAFSPQVTQLLGDYLLEGQRYMLRRTWFDFSARGREPTRRTAYDDARKMAVPARRLAALLPERRAALEALALHVEGKGEPAAFIGTRHFWRSDYMSHQRTDWYASVHMLSRRTAGGELVNSENLAGYWQAMGLTYFVRDTEEYRDILPVWDWNRLPGTTAPDARGTAWRWPGMNVDAVTTAERFVGGVSDGEVGVAAMAFELFDTEARKAWFFFDRAVVALGTGIRSTRPEAVATTLNQTRLRGPVTVDGKPAPEGDNRLSGAGWVWHDGFGYVFPQGGEIRLRNQERSGSWNGINAQYKPETMTLPVFTLTLEHGVKPREARYAYIVRADADAAATARFAAQPTLRILANDARIQAVRDDANGITGVVFRAAGSLRIDDAQQISVNEPCLLLLREKDGHLQVTASNPLNTGLKLDVSLTGPRSLKLRFDLPDGGEAGRSLTLNGD